MTETPPSVHHYTNVAGLVGIVSDSAIWASDVRFLNDSSELRYAGGVLAERLRSEPMPPPDWYEDSPDGPVAMWEGGNTVGRGVAGYLDDVADQFRCYVACFCEYPDLLSQWRGYAPGQGYCMGFDTAMLAPIMQPGVDLGTVIAEVVYDRSRMDELLEPHARGLSDLRTGHPGVAAWHGAWNLLPLLSSMKHAAFREESEWRMIKTVETAPEPGSEIRFRPSPLGVVPYVPLPIARPALRDVRIGPGANADVRAKGVVDLLRAHGFCNVEVLLSEAPFRG